MAADPKPTDPDVEAAGVEHVDETPEPAPDPAAPNPDPAREPVIGPPDDAEYPDPVPAPEPVIGPPDDETDDDDETEAE
jgi:hypothetical protein